MKFFERLFGKQSESSNTPSKSADQFAQENVAEAEFWSGNVSKAIELWEMLAKDGSAKAMYCLGVTYSEGRGVAQDHAKAVAYYRKAADLGYADAQRNLAHKLLSGQGITADRAAAVQLMRKAAESGHTQSEYDYSICLRDGVGVPVNQAESLKWVKKAAAKGFADAQYNVGMNYYNGKGVPKNLAEAAKWFRLAAEQGDAKAQTNLAVAYVTAQGVQKDVMEAVKWFSLAAMQKNEQADRFLGMASKELGADRVPDAQKLAKEWLEQKCEKDAANILGSDGELSEQQRKSALSLMKEALLMRYTNPGMSLSSAATTIASRSSDFEQVLSAAKARISREALAGNVQAK